MSGGAAVKLTIDAGAGPQARSLPCEAKQAPVEKRPEPVTEMTPGIWYVDLTRARMPQVTACSTSLPAPSGVVFDVRGYPTEAGAQILPYLIDARNPTAGCTWARSSARSVSPRAGRASAGTSSRRAPHRREDRVPHRWQGDQLRRIRHGVRGGPQARHDRWRPTAGANGNVAAFVVPGGFRIAFTGMRVTGHDGNSPHHLVGVKPDVPMTPTVAGLRAGRDEVLDRAVALIRGQ